MKTRLDPAALAIAAALLVGLGVAVGFVLGRSPAPAPSVAPHVESSVEPMIVVDQSKIHLLPDASLRLDLPPPPDASLPEDPK